MLAIIRKFNRYCLDSEYGRILLLGLGSRILIFVVAIFGNYFFGIREALPNEEIWDIGLPIVNLFARWDSGHYTTIATSGYQPGSNPLATSWAWFPLYPFLMGVGGKIFSGVLSLNESVVLAGFLLSNILFFVNLILFYKLSEKILDDQRISFIAVIFFVFWPGSLFYSSVYSESLFMTLALGAFYFLEKREITKSTVLGFFAGLTRSNGFLVFIPFVYQGLNKRNLKTLIGAFLLVTPYILFNLYGYVFTGIFPVRESVVQQYWGTQSFFIWQLNDLQLGYARLFIVEFCLVLVPFIYLFSSKELLINVFSVGLNGDREDAKYFGFSLVHFIVLLFYAIAANVHRYAIPMLPLYWIFAKIWGKKPRIGLISLILMIILLCVGTILFSTWRLYW